MKKIGDKQFDRDTDRFSIITDMSVKCKCGHTIEFKTKIDRKLCRHCGHYVYRTKQLEFEYKMKESMKNARAN